MQSKNLEVQPIGLSDLTEYFLSKYQVTAETLIGAETHLRLANDHENESATLFDLLMWYVKAWKYQS